MTPVPETIGSYRLLSVLGEGGMGTVYLAEQKRPVRRRVALKVIKLGMDSTMVLRRFEAERQALAMMEHSNIARVYEAGSTDGGQPYFAMEYVKGQAITEYCDSKKLDVEGRLGLFEQVCSGVQHAHQKGIIHRDLTPKNVLVTVQDGHPTPKIIDFGIARATDHRLVEATLFTEQGQVIGTPEYMSPEQAGLDALDIDTRSDIYTLGALLYELLVGELPFSPAELRAGGLSEMERKIREDDPPKPSTRLTTSKENTHQIAKLRRTNPGMLMRKLKGDLDWIVLKALEKDRSRRYQTAVALAQDIRRHLADEPVLASPPSLSYRTKKFVRRYRGRVIAASAVVTTLIAGIAGTTYFGIEAEAGLARSTLLAQGASLRASQERVKELFETPAWPEHIAAMDQWIQVAPKEPELSSLTEQLERLRTLGDASGEEPEDAKMLETLISDLREFLDDKGILEQIRSRRDWAAGLTDLTESHPEVQFTWSEASAAIAAADGVQASTLYGRSRSPEHPIVFVPQMGLVPLGVNPNTGLLEFYHLRSAWDPDSGLSPTEISLPIRNEAGEFDVTEDTGIIFVLVPGGEFTMGAQKDAPDLPNFDLNAKANESPTREVVGPFFLAKHELTQGQWMRLSLDGRNPSYHTSERNPRATLAHPVDDRSWDMSRDLLLLHGLRLPGGNEWEYACRADTTTRWWTGDEQQDLQGHAHLARMTTPGFEEYAGVHIPVGRLSPNGWGLFDMHGNMHEWCVDPLPSPSGSRPFRMMRGGAFVTVDAMNGRSSAIGHEPPINRAYFYGFRAARDIQVP